MQTHFFTKVVLSSLAGILLIVLLATGYVYYENRVSERDQKTLIAAYTEIRNGEFNGPIADYEQIISNSQGMDTDVILQAKASLATSLWWRNEGDDRARAAGFYKGLIQNESLSPFLRA